MHIHHLRRIYKLSIIVWSWKRSCWSTRSFNRNWMPSENCEKRLKKIDRALRSRYNKPKTINNTIQTIFAPWCWLLNFKFQIAASEGWTRQNCSCLGEQGLRCRGWSFYIEKGASGCERVPPNACHSRRSPHPNATPKGNTTAGIPKRRARTAFRLGSSIKRTR